MYRHLLADLSGIAEERLRDSDGIMDRLEDALTRAGFHVVKLVSHKFDGGGEGFTGVVILSESHAVIHTYPEFGYLAFDLYSCGPVDPCAPLKELEAELKPEKVTLREVPRDAR